MNSKPSLSPLIPLLLAFPALAFAAQAADDDLLGQGDGKTPAQPAATESAPADREGANAASRRALAQGAGLSREGLDHIRRFNDDQVRNATAIVDAAIAFGRAREQLARGGADADAIAEVQANLFWCKKQMNLDALKDYVAHKGEEFEFAAKQMDEVMAAHPDPAQAGAYFARAERSAKANPNDYLQIAIRFTEVAERFPGLPEGTEANKRATAAVQAQIRAIQEAQQAAKQTRFTKPKALVPGSIAVPSAQDQKEALAQIRKVYAKDFAKRSAAAKVRVARKLLDESAKNRQDPALFHQMVSEAIRLAVETEAYESIFDGIDLLSVTFAGVEALAEKQTVLKRMSSKPVATAILKLLTEPSDPAANLVAGKWYCLAAHRWNEGMPMLAMGNDPDFTRIAGMEMTMPRSDIVPKQLADAWYDSANKPRSKDEKLAMLARAVFWYQQALPQMDGMAKDNMVKRISDIDKQLPLDPDSVDWGSITAGQWERLKGRMVTIQARVDRFDPQISLSAGETLRVVPHPTEEWSLIIESWFAEGKKATCNWRGYTSEFRHHFESTSFNLGALLVWVENGDKQNAGIIKGPGRIWFSPFISSWKVGDRSGSIRVKLIPVTDED